ncbi:TPA: hypothetical protein DDW35_01620 [Candidatus Sumerlaeota bacterium]|jgi:hypothetical protein|nr:hypothetical protein [Candidatus Sumerlaeota bacterium]
MAVNVSTVKQFRKNPLKNTDKTPKKKSKSRRFPLSIFTEMGYSVLWYIADWKPFEFLPL